MEALTAELKTNIPKAYAVISILKRIVEDSVKTMTCKKLGGPCDFEHRGESADEVIKAQDRHLREAVSSGDETHQQALKEMKGRWKKPIAGMGWYRKAKKDFAALLES